MATSTAFENGMNRLRAEFGCNYTGGELKGWLDEIETWSDSDFKRVIRVLIGREAKPTLKAAKLEYSRISRLSVPRERIHCELCMDGLVEYMGEHPGFPESKFRYIGRCAVCRQDDRSYPLVDPREVELSESHRARVNGRRRAEAVE